MSEKIRRIPKELIEKEENICFSYDDLKEIEPIDWDEMIIRDSEKKYLTDKDKNVYVVKESEEEYNKEENNK